MNTAPLFTDIIDVDHVAVPESQFDLMRAAGLRGVIAKCTEGQRHVGAKHGFVDSSFAKWRALVFGHDDVLWGAFHFATGSSDGADQAHHLLDHAFATSADLDRAIPVLDWEWNPHKEVGDMSTPNAELFAQTIVDELDRYPMLYTSRTFLHEIGLPLPGSILYKLPLWVVDYGNDPPHLPAGFTDWTLWQYTNGKYAPGPSARFPRTTPGCSVRRFDRSAWRGDRESLGIAWREIGRPT